MLEVQKLLFMLWILFLISDAQIGCTVFNNSYYDAFYYPLWTSKEMTPNKCRDYCKTKLMPVSLLRTSDTCICYNEVPVDTSTSCPFKCSGDFNYTCGGIGTASAWYSSANIPLVRPVVPVYIFEVEAIPGYHLLINETLQLRFIVNEDSYAGVMIETQYFPKTYKLKRYLKAVQQSVKYPQTARPNRKDRQRGWAEPIEET